MKTYDEFEKTLEKFAADWPADGSIIDRVMHDIESNSSLQRPITCRERLPWRSGPSGTLGTPGTAFPTNITRRLLVGSVGLSAVVALVFALYAIGSADRLSAMERMVEKLRDVTSFRYSLVGQNTFTREGAELPVTVEDTGTVWCRWPNSLREEMEIIEYDPKSLPDQRESKLLSKFEAIHPAEKKGIIIDHLQKTILWVPEFQGEFPDYSPVTKLRMVREKSGEMLRDLGSKIIDDRQANGFVMRLEGAEAGSGFDALEVWIDPETDLPIEFGYKVQTETRTQSFRLFDCRWNIELDPQLFVTKAPDGYTDTTPPEGKETLVQIIEALRLYAQLSGGKYPESEPFDASAVKVEMLRMAGHAGKPQDEQSERGMSHQVESATQGLEWIETIVLNRFNADYRGDEVGPSDRDKILLWWGAKAEHSYRVVYGDLRTELLEGDWWDHLYYGDSVEHTE